MEKIKILEVVNQLGLGGTEYALQLFAKFLNKKYFEVTVVSLLKGGERIQLLKDLGIDVIILNGHFETLETLIHQTDVLHWHGGGSLDSELFQFLSRNKPRLVIQTNVFGIYNQSPLYRLIDYDLYISEMILVRRMALDKETAYNFITKRKVLPYPVDVDHITNSLPFDQQIKEFKSKHDLTENFVVGRIGRPDNNKFDLITLTGYAKFAGSIDNTKFLLVGATDEMISHAKELGIINKLVIMDNTADLKTLLIYYKSMDVFLAASQIGESFGMVIAEAMTAGTPVVTISTEDRDNAQIELMDNEDSGIVVKRSKVAIANALKYLYTNPLVRNKLSINAKAKITRDYQAQKIVKSLEQLIFTHLDKDTCIHFDETLIKTYSKEMVSDYERRCKNLFGPFKGLNMFLYKFKRALKHLINV